MKNLRQKTIVEIIEKYEIDTQQRLAELLQQQGFDVTQATVSRDIKDMSLIKVATEHGTYKYALPHTVQNLAGTHKFYSVFHDSIIAAEAAGNLLVVKTYPGMANAVCSAMERLDFQDLIGCIAGDDTIFMAFRKEETALVVQNKLLEFK